MHRLRHRGDGLKGLKPRRKSKLPRGGSGGQGEAVTGQSRSGSGGLRSRFACPRLRLSPRRFSFSLRGTRVDTRGVSRRSRRSIFVRNRSSARARLRCWLRSSRATTRRPEGRCTSRTPLSVVFWCCPPGPPARKVCTRHSARSSSSESEIFKSGLVSLSIAEQPSSYGTISPIWVVFDARRICRVPT